MIYVILILCQYINFLTIVFIFWDKQANEGFNTYFIIILFVIDFDIDFSSFKVDSEPDKYLSNAFNPILLIRHNEVPGPEVKNGNEKDIKNPGHRFFLSKRSLQHLPSIFN